LAWRRRASSKGRRKDGVTRFGTPCKDDATSIQRRYSFFHEGTADHKALRMLAFTSTDCSTPRVSQLCQRPKLVRQRSSSHTRRQRARARLRAAVHAAVHYYRVQQYEVDKTEAPEAKAAMTLLATEAEAALGAEKVEATAEKAAALPSLEESQADMLALLDNLMQGIVQEKGHTAWAALTVDDMERKLPINTARLTRKIRITNTQAVPAPSQRRARNIREAQERQVHILEAQMRQLQAQLQVAQRALRSPILTSPGDATGLLY